MLTKDAFNDQKYSKNKHHKILIIYSYDAKLKFQQPLLQSSVSHDPSEIILTCWFGAKETCIIRPIINIKIISVVVLNIFLWKPWYIFFQDWVKGLKKKKHLFETKLH